MANTPSKPAEKPAALKGVKAVTSTSVPRGTKGGYRTQIAKPAGRK